MGREQLWLALLIPNGSALLQLLVPCLSESIPGDSPSFYRSQHLLQYGRNSPRDAYLFLLPLWAVKRTVEQL